VIDLAEVLHSKVKLPSEIIDDLAELKSLLMKKLGEEPELVEVRVDPAKITAIYRVGKRLYIVAVMRYRKEGDRYKLVELTITPHVGLETGLLHGLVIRKLMSLPYPEVKLSGVVFDIPFIATSRAVSLGNITLVPLHGTKSLEEWLAAIREEVARKTESELAAKTVEKSLRELVEDLEKHVRELIEEVKPESEEFARELEQTLEELREAFTRAEKLRENVKSIVKELREAVGDLKTALIKI